MRNFILVVWLSVLSCFLLEQNSHLTGLENRLDDSDFAWAKVVRRIHNDIYQLQNPPKPKPVKPLAPRIDLLEKKMDAVVDAIVQDQLEKSLEQEMRRQLVPKEGEMPPYKWPDDVPLSNGPGRTKL